MSATTIPTRTGITNLPFHYSKVPLWQFDRMVRLARKFTMAIVAVFGAEEMLRRLSHPYWFQDLRLHSRLGLAFKRYYHYPVL